MHTWSTSARPRHRARSATLVGRTLVLREGREVRAEVFVDVVGWRVVMRAGRLARDWCAEGVGPLVGTCTSGVPYPRPHQSAEADARRDARRDAVVHRHVAATKSPEAR